MFLVIGWSKPQRWAWRVSGSEVLADSRSECVCPVDSVFAPQYTFCPFRGFHDISGFCLDHIDSCVFHWVWGLPWRSLSFLTFSIGHLDPFLPEHLFDFSFILILIGLFTHNRIGAGVFFFSSFLFNHSRKGQNGLFALFRFSLFIFLYFLYRSFLLFILLWLVSLAGRYCKYTPWRLIPTYSGAWTRVIFSSINLFISRCLGCRWSCVLSSFCLSAIIG